VITEEFSKHWCNDSDSGSNKQGASGGEVSHLES